MNKFFEYDQNNSGGSFVVNDKLCHRLIIEAPDSDAAERIALDLGVYFNGVGDDIDCPCCGDRWHTWADEIGAHDFEMCKASNIEEFAQNSANRWGFTSPDVRIFYLDGSVKEIFSERVKK